METTLPPCGIYRTTAPVGSIPAGRFVYFHNHGNPGPGIYLPKVWHYNRAEFEDKGHTLSDPSQAQSLEPLPSEGFYRVAEAFYCCENQCMHYHVESLIQLGYNGSAEPILFLPELVNSMLAVPAEGKKTSLHALKNLRRLHVPVTGGSAASSH